MFDLFEDQSTTDLFRTESETRKSWVKPFSSSKSHKMGDFTYKKVLKPRECIPLELLITHGSPLEAEKHTLIVMKK